MNYNSSEKFDNSKNINIYFFWASWCGHCRTYKPEFYKFKDILLFQNKNLTFIDIQSDSNSDDSLINKFNIDGFPTVLIEYNDGTFKKFPGGIHKLEEFQNLIN